MPGDRVLALLPIPGKPLQARYYGPYTVDKKISDVNYIVNIPGRRKQKHKITLSFADRKDMKKFFDALKTVYDPQSSGTTPLLSADGTSLLTDTEAIFKRWAEHFDGVLNRPSSINDEAINRLPQVECKPLLDELPTVSETVKAIKLLSSARLQDQMQYLQRSTKQEVLQLQRN